MDEAQAKYLDIFPTWLRSLADDAERVSAVLGDEHLATDARESVAGGLNYLFKSLDLIPDGIDDIGYLDDAFVLRVCADLATRDDMAGLDEQSRTHLTKLAKEAGLVKEFLENDYTRFETYVRGLKRGAARGRAARDIVSNTNIRVEFLSDLKAFAKSYETPSFTKDEKNLIKLRAFFDAKLPK